MASQAVAFPSQEAPTQDAEAVVFPSQAPPQTSQGLGFYKGIMVPIDRAAQALSWLTARDPRVDIPNFGPEAAAGAAAKWIAGKAGLPGLPSAGDVRQTVAEAAQRGVVPGKIGEFAGNVVGTLPTAALGPLAGGAVAGGLLGESDTPGGTVGDMLMGAAGGKVGDLAGKGLAAVAKPLATSVFNKVQGWTQPLASATRDAGQYVYGLLGDKAPMDVRMAGAMAGGKPLTAAEAIGGIGIRDLAALGKRSGTTADLLSSSLVDRTLQAPDRILGDYAQAAGIDPAAARGDMDTILSVGRADAGDLYRTALSRPGGVWSPVLDELSKRPVIRKAIAQAADDLRNAGKDPTAFGFTAPDPVTGVSWITKQRPTAEAWDLIKKNVSGQIERDPFGKPIPDAVSRGNYNIGVAGKDLTDELRDAIPGYGAALDRSGDYLTLNKAFQNGQDFILNPDVTAAQLSAQVAKLSPAELQAFTGGIANKLFDRAQLKTFGAGLFDAPLVRQKLMIALGPQNATQFLDNMKLEKGMAAGARRMMPGIGSITSDILNATGEQDASQKGAAVIDAIYAGIHAAHGNALGAGARLLSAGRRLGWGAEGKMPEVTRDEVGRLLLMSPADLADHLESLDRTFNPPISGQVAGAVNAARPVLRAAGAAAVPAMLSPMPDTSTGAPQ